MSIKENLAAEIDEARAFITKEREEGRTKTATADKLVEKLRGEGKNPLTSKELFEEVDKAYLDADQHIQNAAEVQARIDALAKHEAGEVMAAADGDPDRAIGKLLERSSKSLGRIFCESSDYKALAEKLKGVGLEGMGQFTSGGVKVMERELVKATIFQAATVDGDAMIPIDQRLFPPVQIPQRQLRLRDLVSVSETDSDQVDYTVQTTRTDVAAETPYGTAAPEATYVWEKRSANVKRIPQFTPATEGQLMDVAQLRSLIDNHLVYGVGKRLDSQIYAGNGVGDNITGITNATGTGNYDFTADTETSVSDGLHKAITVVRLALEGEDPTAFVLHPNDLQNFVLEREGGASGAYLNVPSATVSGLVPVWGLPVVANTVATEGTGLVGQFKLGAELWLRTGIVVSASNSHNDFFTKGLVAVMATLRAAFAVTQPKAFCEIANIP